MTVAATSIKIPRRLKTRIERLARNTGESSHAFMLRALAGQVEATERYQAFLQDGVRADEAMLRSGLGYAAADVHAYLEAKVAGRRGRRPRPVRWRG
jgi:predicted transcriptional regulator